jgi:hypothetical protein
MARRGARNETNSGGGINAFFESLFDVLGDTNKNNIAKLKRSLSEGSTNSNVSGDGDIKSIVAEKAVQALADAPPTPSAEGYTKKGQPMGKAGDPLGKRFEGDMFGVTEKPQEGDTSSPTHGEIAALQQRIQDKDQIIESLRSQIETMQRALSQGPATPAPTKPVGDARLDPMAGLPEGRVAAPAPGALPGLGARPELGGAGLAGGGGGRPIDPRIALGLGG